MTAESLPYEDFWYIKLINESDKNPLETWGGYSQDFEASDTVYSHEDVLASDHENWGVVGIKGDDRYLLIFDLDVHKAPEGFDPDDVNIPTETAVVRSQNGGLHVYFIVKDPEGAGSEGDYSMVYNLGWDIDIRGSYVKHHVVAPAAIPGVGGRYELANDNTLLTVHNPGTAADRIRYLGDPESEKNHGESLLAYSPDRSYSGSVSIDRDAEPPEEMPTCYHRGLQIRAANPDDPNLNTHKVNVLTALCGLSAGYSTETVLEHFCDEYAPGENADRERTRYQLEHLLGGGYSPPSISTLREYGILEDDETCECSIEYHGGAGRATSPTFDVVREAVAQADGGATVSETVEPEIGDGGETEAAAGPEARRGEAELRARVLEVLTAYDEGEISQQTAVHRCALEIADAESFVYPPADAEDWRTVLYRYDAETGVYRPDGERYCEELCECLLGDFLTNTQANEIVGKIRRMSGIRRDRLETPPYRLVVGNGVLDLRTGELEPWTPDEYHRTRISVEYHPDAECPRIDEFFHEIVESKDVRTLYQLAAHCLYREYAAEKAAMLVGGGRNGKSVYLDLIEQLAGEDNVTHRSLQQLSHKSFAASDLHGKLANFHPDMSGEKIKDLGTFKQLTGRDTMLGDVKYEQPIKFENYASLIFAANTMPAMDENTHALWRRWIYLNFPNTFEPGDEGTVPKRVLMRELTADAELEGLLARCVEEIGEWWDGRDWFTKTMGPDAVRRKMKRAGEPVYAFATTCLEPDEDGHLPKEDVREAYRRYAREEDLPTESENVFGEKILHIQDLPIEAGQNRYNGTRRETYQGVSWTSRGEQIMGLEPTERGEGSRRLGRDGDGGDGGPRGREDELLEAMRSLGANDEPASKAMILGRASASMDIKQAEYALEELKDRGAIYQPADANPDEWLIS